MTRLLRGFAYSALGILSFAAGLLNPPPAPAGLRVPERPAVFRLGATKVLVIINPSGNTVGTRYAIEDADSGSYVQPDGSLGETPYFQIFSAWGSDAGIVVMVSPNTRYGFRVSARTGS